MSVFRVSKTKNYTVMSNHHLKDKSLSFKAKGLLSYMLSLPDDWDYSLEGLCNIGKDNLTSVKSALKELKEKYYIKINKLMPNQTKSGRIEYEYIIFEHPYNEKQDVGFLPLEFLPIENQRLLNTKKVNTKKEKVKRENKNKIKKEFENNINENYEEIYEN